MATNEKILDATYITDEDVKTGGELVHMPPPAQMVVARPPDVVLAEATEAAKALKAVIDGKPKKVVFNGNVYLEFEDWQTVGKFYGATVKVTDTKYVEYGEVKGFEAKAVVVNVATGMEISGAEAMCLNDEPNWKKKPLFQLKSMAQTRASAKALRNVFAWVVVLAGYKPTPAEEMDGVKPRKEQEAPSWEKVEGTISEPRMGGGFLWFYIGDNIFCIPPMQGQDMKVLLGEADGAEVELKVTAKTSTKGGKEYQTVKEIVRFDPKVPF